MWHLALYIFHGLRANMLGIVSHVVVSSFAKRWFGSPLPPAFTSAWFSYAWTNFDLGQVLGVTLFIVVAVVVLALLIGFPAAYILARRNFRFKSAILLLYFLPLVIPQMTYGIPLATTLYRWRRRRRGGRHPAVSADEPLAVFVLMPFFRAISVNLEWAVRCSAPAGKFSAHLFPLLIQASSPPGFSSRQHHIEFQWRFCWRVRDRKRSWSHFITTSFAGGVRRFIRSTPWR